jgi:large subunit ribosomal protein L1
MPNPKNGTVTANPEEVAKKFANGQMRYKTEAKNPILHVAVGKMSFGDKKLSENIKAMLAAIGTGKMKKVVLKSTMSPAIKIDFSAVK